MIVSQQAQTLFAEAHDLDAEAREELLNRTCANDITLREEVEALLQASNSASNYFQKFSERLNTITTEQVDAQQPGLEQVGPWRLLYQIGRGGMGAVYLAERADHQYNRRVALKTLPKESGDPVSRYRFMAERQILARLTHENIARFLDGGMTDDGIPYFVMDYVEGKPIDQYCQDNRLTIKEKLHLFLKACDAVDYAHRHLVIHRDLKPSNIIVDPSGSPKLLDFGIAKILDENKPSADLTQAAFRPLTRNYASPEMLRGESVDVTADVYSAGVVLYELLTGRRPYEDKKSAQALLDNIRGDAPPTPSTLALDSFTKNSLINDLDTIVLKAIKFDQQDRYSSIEQLSRDILAYLKGYPIEAKKSSSLYIASKFIQRNKKAVIISAAFIMTLIVATSATTVNMIEAQKQRDIANYQKQREQVNNEFLKMLLGDIGDGGKPFTLAEMLDRGSTMLNTQYANGNDSIASVLLQLAASYHSLGDINKTIDHLEQAKVLARQSNDLDTLANIQCFHMRTVLRRNPEEAEVYYNEAMSILQNLDDINFSTRIDCARATANRQESMGQIDSAIATMEDAVEKAEHDNPDSIHTLTIILNELGALYYQEGLFDKAYNNTNQIKILLETTGRSHSVGYLITSTNLVRLLTSGGEFVHAKEIIEKIFAGQQYNLLSNLPPPGFYNNYASILSRLDEDGKALEYYQSELDRSEKLNNYVMQANAMIGIANLYRKQQSFSQAEEMLEKSIELIANNLESNRAIVQRKDFFHAMVLLDKGDLAAAETLTEDFLAGMGNAPRNNFIFTMRFIELSARIALQNQDFDKAAVRLEELTNLSIRNARHSNLSADVGTAYFLWGELYSNQGENDKAQQNFELAYDILSKALGSNHAETLEAKARIRQY